jgi:acyl-CoA thioesterase I
MAAATVEKPQPPELTVFMGDSITARWAIELIVPGAINKGIPGDSPCGMRDRFQADVLDLHPTRVHILGGANAISSDTPDAACIVEMATRAVAAGIRTYVGTVTPGFDRPQAGVEYFNAQIRVAAPALGFTIVDYYPAMFTAGAYFDQALYLDTVHPNAAGYARMETVLGLALAH